MKPAPRDPEDALPIIAREPPWPDGTRVVWLAVPFPVGRKPPLPARLLRHARRAVVPLAALHATQAGVTAHGVRAYLADPGEKVPLLYQTDAGLFVADGHHRLVAAYLRGATHAAVDVVDAPRAKPNRAPTFAVTPAMRAALEEGLWLARNGYRGAGLRDATLDDARAMLRTGRVGLAKVLRMHGWHARHGAAPREVRARAFPSPSRTAWLLWAGAPGADLARRIHATRGRRTATEK